MSHVTGPQQRPTESVTMSGKFAIPMPYARQIAAPPVKVAMNGIEIPRAEPARESGCLEKRREGPSDAV